MLPHVNHIPCWRLSAEAANKNTFSEIQHVQTNIFWGVNFVSSLKRPTSLLLRTRHENASLDRLCKVSNSNFSVTPTARAILDESALQQVQTASQRGGYHVQSHGDEDRVAHRGGGLPRGPETGGLMTSALVEFT